MFERIFRVCGVLFVYGLSVSMWIVLYSIKHIHAHIYVCSHTLDREYTRFENNVTRIRPQLSITCRSVHVSMYL